MLLCCLQQTRWSKLKSLQWIFKFSKQMENHSLIQMTLLLSFLRHIVIFSLFCLTGLLIFYLLILQWMKLLIDSIFYQRHYTNTGLLYLIELVMWTFLVNYYCCSKLHSVTKTVFVLYSCTHISSLKCWDECVYPRHRLV